MNAPLEVAPPRATPVQVPARRTLAPWAVAAAVLTGQAMASLDSAIVNVAGPQMQRDLGLSGPALQLAVYSYLLAYAVALVTGARIGGRHGYGRLFTAGLILFTLSSLACGLALNPAMLVAARVTQGLGAALLVPQVLSLLQVTFPAGAARQRAMSLYGMVLALGVAAGQLLGGVLVSADLLGTGWRPIFLVNVPAGLAVLAFAAGRLPSGSAGRGARLDLTGAALLGVTILVLVVPLTFGADLGWPLWSWLLLASAPAVATWFIRYESRLSRSFGTPLIDPRLVTTRAVRSGLTGIFALHASYGGLLFTTALFLQHGLHRGALQSGLTFAAYAAGFATASLTWTRLPPAWQPRLPAAAFAVFVLACGTLAALTWSAVWPWPATALLAVAGAAHGTGFDTLVHRTASGVPASLAAAFSGVLATVNQLAIVTGIAMAGTLYLTAAPGLGLPPLGIVLVTLAAVLAIAGGRETQGHDAR